MACLFLFNSVIFVDDAEALAIWSAMQRIDARRMLEVKKLESCENIIFAEPGTEDERRLDIGQDAKIVDGGVIIVRAALKESPLELLKLIHHKKTELLMFALAGFDAARRDEISALIKDDQTLREAYFEVFPGSRSAGLPEALLVNDMIAAAFSLIILDEEELVSRKELTPQELRFLETIQPVVQNHPGHFSEIFRDTRAREVVIRTALANGLSFPSEKRETLDVRRKTSVEAAPNGLPPEIVVIGITDINTPGLLIHGVRGPSNEQVLSILSEGIKRGLDAPERLRKETMIRPEVISLSMVSNGGGYVASAAAGYGPGQSGDSRDIAFVVDPVYVKRHPQEFLAIGISFKSYPDYFGRILNGIPTPDLSIRFAHFPMTGTFADEIWAEYIPPEAIGAVIANGAYAKELAEIINRDLPGRSIRIFNSAGKLLYDIKSSKTAPFAATPVLTAEVALNETSPETPKTDNRRPQTEHREPEPLPLGAAAFNGPEFSENIQTFSQDPETLIKELQEERKKVDEIHATWRPAVTVFGSARIPKRDPMYRKAIRFGMLVCRFLVPIRTGAGPSMMEAPLRGFIKEREKAKPAGGAATDKTQGIRITLPFEQKTSPSVEENYTFEHFMTRKLGLYDNSIGIAVYPGGFGTADELFEAWLKGLPIVLIGNDYWTPIIKALYASWEKIGRTEKRMPPPLITDSEEEAALYIRDRHFKPIKPDTQMTLEANKEISETLRVLSQWPASVTCIGVPIKDSREAGEAKKAFSYLIDRGISVRAGNRGVLLDDLFEVAAEHGRMDMMQASLFIEPGSEPTENEKRLQKSIHSHDISNHHVILTENSRAFIFLPGGIHTMNRLFDLIALMQTKKMPAKPIILIGREFWQPIKDAIVKSAISYTIPLINPKDADLLQVVDTADEALAALGIDHDGEREQLSGKTLDVGREMTTEKRGTREEGREMSVDDKYTAKLAESAEIAADYGRKGQSLILYADDILNNAAMEDLEESVKKVLVEHKVLDGGKIILFAKEELDAIALEHMIKKAGPGIEIITVTQNELQRLKPDAKKSDAKEAKALLEYAKTKGAKDVLAIIRGPVKMPEEFAEFAKSYKVPVIQVGVEKAFYSFAQAIAIAIEIKQNEGRNGWLWILPPVQIITKDIEERYQKYQKSLEALAAA